MSAYQRRKEEIRVQAICWQELAGETISAWSDILGAGEYFREQGKRYGLLREFRENGII